MAANMGNAKLRTQLWASAIPFFTAKARPPVPISHPHIRGFASSHRTDIYSRPKASQLATAQNAERRSISARAALGNHAVSGGANARAGALGRQAFTAKGAGHKQTSLLAGNLWRRQIHQQNPKMQDKAWASEKTTLIPPNTAKRLKSTKPEGEKVDAANKSPAAHTKAESTPPDAANHNPEGHSYFHLPHLPKMPHRPTKEELLAAATGFWSRLKIRFKWFSIRSARPWNVDDWSAFISWFVLGHIVWILVGTTTFVSLLILAINTVVAQETLARWVGDYLTQSTGVKVVFESAVVPKWKNGVISFANVFVSRRPGQGPSKVSKGSSLSAAAAAAAKRQAEQDGSAEPEELEDDGNYTQFDVTLDTVNVTLSFAKWWNGKGLLKDVEIRGVRGVLDRTHVVWPDEYVDPRVYKHEHNVGDFEIENFRMEDLLLTIHQPKGFRPYSVSVYTCELPQLRKQWLFYDFLSANQMSGSFDGSLFNIHPHQSHSPAHNSEYGNPDVWKKHSRMRIDGLKIDHLNRGVEGLFGWIYEGNVDIVADIMFPADSDESIAKVMSDLYDRLEATVTSNRYRNFLENNPYTADLDTPEQRQAFEEQNAIDHDKRFLIMDMKVHLNDVRAAVPLFTRDLSYINQALIRPIVAYINSRKTFIPINCRIVKKAHEFDGSWTIYDCGLMEDLSAETYDAFAKDVTDSQARMRRFKKVGIWSISLALQALFMTMSGSVA
ncbi:hypothetical protein V495_01621 [Pseudogymnoascus sp. VKM F-4514 (FW-929)]|nr:hypothetical protein V495_01621 [Pseudogymnoascus sp. VKM F-4514 (FW-929)]KFY65202.1 hypothetical protein V497_01461 [Pseudogymnoascus sp. VKM F-4516 (FW-969)]